MTTAIAIRALTKRYGRLVAVRDLDLAVETGEIFGFLGVNGAGKSTTIRILLDFVRPTSGRASIFGHDCQSEGLAARAAVGYLPDVGRVWPAAQTWARLSPFHFFSPLELVMGTPLRSAHLAVLVGAGCAGVAASYVLFARRDI